MTPEEALREIMAEIHADVLALGAGGEPSLCIDTHAVRRLMAEAQVISAIGLAKGCVSDAEKLLGFAPGYLSTWAARFARLPAVLEHYGTAHQRRRATRVRRGT